MPSHPVVRFSLTVLALVALAAPVVPLAVPLELLVPRTSPPGAPKTEGASVQTKLQAGYEALNGNDLVAAAKARPESARTPAGAGGGRPPEEGPEGR